MKRIIAFIFALLLSGLFSCDVNAENGFGDYGQAQIESALPEQAKEYLYKNEIFADNGGAAGLTVGGVIKDICDVIYREAVRPFQMLLALLGVIFVCAITSSLGEKNGISDILAVVCTLVGAGVMCGYIDFCIELTSGMLNSVSIFMMTYIPVFAGIIAVSGYTGTAVAYNSVVLVAVQIISQLAVIMIIPFASCILGVSAAGAVNPDLNIHKAAETVKKIIVWVMGLLMTVFVGILSLQTFVTSSADSVALKAAKFAVSSAVPIIGGSVSEALSTVNGSIGVLKSSTGSFGIIAAAVIMLPTLISVMCYRLALMIASAVSDLFGVNTLTALIKSGENVLAVLTALISCFFVLLTVSTAIMLVAGRGLA